jgi:cellobiose epimerase
MKPGQHEERQRQSIGSLRDLCVFCANEVRLSSGPSADLRHGVSTMRIRAFPLRTAFLAGALAAVTIGSALGAVPSEAGSDSDIAALTAWTGRIEADLRGNILPFWREHARDRTRGGFFGEIGTDLVVKKDAPRGSLLTARILWTYSAAWRLYRDPADLAMAAHALEDLQRRCWDAEHGGLFWSITADGRPLDTRKSIYVQVFGIYALSEHHRATGDAASLARAIELFRLVEKHARDREHGGYFEAFARDWKQETNPRRSAMELPAPKSQNTHLHVMEAFTNLLRVWPDPELRAAQLDLVGIMLTRVLDPRTHHLHLFLYRDWTPRSDKISFGHDIEAAWLLTEAAEVLGDADLLTRAKAAAVEIARVTLAEGVDKDGGVFDEAGPNGLTRPWKEWWPQAEAMVGFLNAWQISGDETFLRAARRSWEFIETKLIDRKNGEWFRSVTREGTTDPKPAKVSFWKCPYHNSRAEMEALARLRAAASPP